MTSKHDTHESGNSRKAGRETYNEKYFKKYGQLTVPYEKMRPRLFATARALSFLNPKRVLDVGCAMGFLVSGFRTLGIEAFGVEISNYAVKKSREARHYLILSDVEGGIPFKNNCFDLVTMIEVLEHLHEYDIVLKEVSRVLKPGGHLYLTIPDARYHKPSRDHVSLKDKRTWVKIFYKHGLKAESSALTEWIALRDWKGPRAKKFMLHKLWLVGDLLRFGYKLLERMLGHHHWLRFLLRVNSETSTFQSNYKTRTQSKI